MKWKLAALALLLSTASAWASACNGVTSAAGTYTFNDGNGNAQTVNVYCDGSGQFYPFFTPTGKGGEIAAGATGSAVPAGALYMGIISGGNLTGWDKSVTVGSGGIASGAVASGAVASGAYASGSIGSGAVASGAVASGAFASGALASGSIAAGAQVDLLTMRGTKAAGTAAANSMLVGAVYNSTPPTLTDGQQAALQVGPRGGLLIGNAGYPAAAVPETISGTGTTGATTATLATGASTTTYICGFSIRANANAAATGNATVTGTITGTLNFTQWTAPNASGLGVTEMIFTPCVPASGTNQAIAVVSAAPGTGGVVSVTAWGYQL